MLFLRGGIFSTIVLLGLGFLGGCVRNQSTSTATVDLKKEIKEEGAMEALIPIEFTDTISLLPPPEQGREWGCDALTAFAQRRSCVLSEMTDAPLDLRTLSDLLWAAYGYNRVENPGQLPMQGRITAPSSMNSQEMILYVAFAQGLYRYSNAYCRLERVLSQDLRPALAGMQEEAAQAPLIILLMADKEALRAKDPEKKLRASLIDGGIISQNISLCCSALGLKTRVRTSMDTEAIRTALDLDSRYEVILNQPVAR